MGMRCRPVVTVPVGGCARPRAPAPPAMPLGQDLDSQLPLLRAGRRAAENQLAHPGVALLLLGTGGAPQLPHVHAATDRLIDLRGRLGAAILRLALIDLEQNLRRFGITAA